MKLYYPRNYSTLNFSGSKPLKIAIVTSLRDIVGEDKNGSVVDTSQGKVYMMGVIEALSRGIEENIAGIRSALQVVGIIYDDTIKDIENLPSNFSNNVPFPLLYHWMHPLNLKDFHTGDLLIDKTHNHPSLWRFMDIDSQERKKEKEVWEKKLGYIVFHEMKADILLSDHLMVVLETLVRDDSDYIGRLLNIHPAITNENDPDHLRGPTPTTDAISKAKNQGDFYTGSTLHYLTKELDGGEQIAAAKRTKVVSYDSLQDLRAKNYPCKIAVTIAGLIHYRENHIYNQSNIYPTRHSSKIAQTIQVYYQRWVERISPIYSKNKLPK